MFDMAFELGANFRIINVQVQHSIFSFANVQISTCSMWCKIRAFRRWRWRLSWHTPRCSSTSSTLTGTSTGRWQQQNSSTLSQIGNVVCAAYPLTVVDTIDVHTGELNERSALNMIVFGVSDLIGQSLDGKPFSEERGTLGHDWGGGRRLPQRQVESLYWRQVDPYHVLAWCYVRYIQSNWSAAW